MNPRNVQVEREAAARRALVEIGIALATAVVIAVVTFAVLVLAHK